MKTPVLHNHAECASLNRGKFKGESWWIKWYELADKCYYFTKVCCLVQSLAETTKKTIRSFVLQKIIP